MQIKSNKLAKLVKTIRLSYTFITTSTFDGASTIALLARYNVHKAAAEESTAILNYCLKD